MRIVAYEEVLQAAKAVGLRCVYPNGAAFSPAEAWHVAGWVTGDDPTLRPMFKKRMRQFDADALPAMVADACFEVADEVWIAPVHHWAAELDHGVDEAGGTTADVFASAGVDIDALRMRRQADAIVVPSREALASLLADLLPRLWKTDFTILLPGVPIVVTLHHHRQIWWRCRDERRADELLNS